MTPEPATPRSSPAAEPGSQPWPNLLANYAMLGLLAAITLLLVPLYVGLLGRNEWGRLSLCLTLQNLLFALDLIIAPLMLRAIARAQAATSTLATYRLFARLYGGVAIVAAVLVGALFLLWSPQHGDPGDVPLVWLMALALLQFVLQFANTAALGYWNGLQLQRRSNARLAAFTLAKHALALSLLWFWHASAVLYLAGFVFVSALEWQSNRTRVQRDLAALPMASSRIGLDWHDLGGFTVAALVGYATTQIDRGWLALVLPAADYGEYYLLSVPMLSLFSLQAPISRVWLPRLATAVHPMRVVTSMLKASVLVVVLPCVLLALWPEAALRLWLHDAGVAAHGAATFRLLLLAVASCAAFAPFGTLLFVRHRNGRLAAINVCVLLAQALILFALTSRLGMLAGGLAWLACGLLQLLGAAVSLRRTDASAPATAAAAHDV